MQLISYQYSVPGYEKTGLSNYGPKGPLKGSTSHEPGRKLDLWGPTLQNYSDAGVWACSNSIHKSEKY
jgi:hypothetical protein